MGDVEHFVANNPEKNRLDSIIERCESPILHLSSKSGETVETISCYNYLKENFNLSNRTVVTTSEGSELATYAKKNDMVLFESTKQISGRFSAFSYYGIIPSYLCSVDVEELCDVARNQLSSESEAYNLGIQIADLVDSTDIIFVGSYSYHLEGFNDWVIQLWSESLGKMNDGTHISTGIGPNFQHARLQRLLDGSRNICAFILYLESESTVDTSLNYDGKTKIELSDILEISYSEVTDLLTQNNVPIIQREITRTALDISTLMIAFEIAVIELGRRRDIDVFTQDAVDSIKGRLRESF